MNPTTMEELDKVIEDLKHYPHPFSKTPPLAYESLPITDELRAAIADKEGFKKYLEVQKRRNG